MIRNKRILVITHQLSRTGAPIVLLDMVRRLKSLGYEIDLISMLDGELRSDVEELGIAVEIKEFFFQEREYFRGMTEGYDLVISNTLITYEVIHVLNGADVPVLWWLHEGERYFDYFASVLPDFTKLGDSIHVYSVSHYVQHELIKRFQYSSSILHFAVKDVTSIPTSGAHNCVKFMTVGTYSKVKAQDILTKAIRMLPEEILRQAEFYFYGNEQTCDGEIFCAVRDLADEFENVHRYAALPREQILAEMDSLKDNFHFEGRIHEQIVSNERGAFHYVQSPISVLHTGYDLSEEDRQKKSERNIFLLLAEKQRLEGEGDPKRKEQLPYILFQLGKAYYMRHDYKSACEYFSEGLYFDLDPELEYVIDMVETYGYALENAGRASEAMFFENIYEEFGKTADFQFLMGIIYMNNELFDLAIPEFQKAGDYGPALEGLKRL